MFWPGKVMLAKLDSNIGLKNNNNNNKIIKVARYFQYRITQIGPSHYQIPKYHILQAKINQNIDPAMHNFLLILGHFFLMAKNKIFQLRTFRILLFFEKRDGE